MRVFLWTFEMITYQLNQHFLFLCINPDYEVKPHLAVLVPPPEVEEGFVARWITSKDPVTSLNFGNEGTGQWEIVKDNRGKKLYNTMDGSIYTGEYIGIGDFPDGVTDIAPPSPLHEWNGTEWEIDPELENEQAREKAIADVNARIASALAVCNQAILPLQDAVELDIATPQEVDKLKEWKRYRVLLNRVPTQDGYPFDVTFPVEPV